MPEQPSKSGAGVVIVVVLALLALPCLLGVVSVVGWLFFSMAPVQSLPDAPMVETKMAEPIDSLGAPHVTGEVKGETTEPVVP